MDVRVRSVETPDIEVVADLLRGLGLTSLPMRLSGR
jgi:hypothetical protein